MIQNKKIERDIIERKANININTDATYVRQYCFYNCGFSSSDGFDSVQTIKQYAFGNCKFPNSTITFPSATIFGEECFSAGLSVENHFYLPAIEAIDNSLPISFGGVFSSGKAHLHFTNAQYIDIYDYDEVTGHETPKSINYAHIYPSLTVWSSGVCYNKGSMYFHFTENDSVLFDAGNAVDVGSSKTNHTYSFYTDNSTIKSQVLAKADSYTTVTVYHLDGSEW